MTDVVTLQAGSMRMDLSPRHFGAVTRLSSDLDGRRIDWLRPAPTSGLDSLDARSLSCFPLVPFSNRIRDGRFAFDGREIRLPPNFPPEPHAIHGDGWQSPWALVEQTTAGATLELAHAPAAWPFAYRARQRFELEPQRARLRMTVVNESATPMPLGFGFHPFFVRTPRARLTASVDGLWQTDGNAMPVAHVPLPDTLPLTGAGIVPDAVRLDTHFTGFAGRAHVAWPELQAGLQLTTEGPFTCLVIYTPRGRDFFCAEPVTNCLDAFNLAAQGRTDTGMLVLAPGAEAHGVVTLTPEWP